MNVLLCRPFDDVLNFSVREINKVRFQLFDGLVDLVVLLLGIEVFGVGSAVRGFPYVFCTHFLFELFSET